MARGTSELADIASISLQVAEAEIQAVGDPEAMLWALEQIRRAEECLRLIMADDDIPQAETPAQTRTDAA